MIKNYLRVAIRNLRKGALYSAINLFGLLLGTTICILILSYVHDAYSFDKFHEKSDQIYRSWVKEHYQGDVFFNSTTPFILGPTLQESIPEIQQSTRYVTINSRAKYLEFADQEVIHVVEPNFLNIFDFELLRGDHTNILQDLSQVVITNRCASKYFGSADPMDQTIGIQVAGEWRNFTISGVMADPPENSSIQFEFLIPFDHVESFTSESGRNSWTVVFPETYVVLDKDVDPSLLQDKIAHIIDNKVSDIYKPGEYLVGLQPLTDIHLNADIPVGIVPISDGKYPRILTAIGLLILLLACINFTTLAIGRSVTRAKEVAVRKVAGATRTQLMIQFWTEAIVTAAIAVTAGLLTAKYLLPYFNEMTSRNLSIDINARNLIYFGLLAMITGVAAGAYPALVVSGFAPIKALTGRLFKTGGQGSHQILRWMVGVQYMLSIILIISTLVMQSQIKYLQNKNLGFDQEHIVVLPYNVSGQRLSEMWREAGMIENRLKKAIEDRQDITQLTTSTHTIGTPGWMQVGYNDKIQDRFRKFKVQQIGANYLSMMSIPIKEGRDFHPDPTADAKGVIINQAMIDQFNLEDPIGKQLPGPFKEYQVIGTTDNFQFASLHSPVDPLVMAKDAIPLFQAAPDMSGTDGLNPKISLKITTSDISATLRFLENTWSKIAPEQSFNYAFLDDDLNRQYQTERRLGKVVTLATILAIVIAALGLFGIGVLTIMQKKREIGVRKVLGASVWSIMVLLNRKFTSIVFLAALIAIPIAWYFMSDWLQTFAFQIKLSPIYFLVASFVAVFISWISIGGPSLTAAMSNPVDSISED